MQMNTARIGVFAHCAVAFLNNFFPNFFPHRGVMTPICAVMNKIKGVRWGVLIVTQN